MLRFNRSDRHPPNYLSQREQLRALRLVLALGLVVLLINVVRSPRAVQMLGLFFGGKQQAQQEGDRPVAADRAQQRPSPAPAAAQRNRFPAHQADAVKGLADVKDNAPFRSDENEPWYQLLGILHNSDAETLAAGSVGELIAVQLLEQPDVYRGRLVDVRGTARQAIASDPLSARLDSQELLRMYFHPLTEFPAFALRTAITQRFLPDYHRVVVQQPGAAVPIVVFTLGVPDGFPTGAAISEPVAVSGGYFFKNWLYAAEDGIGVAPVVLAREIEWRPTPPPALPQPPPTSDIALALALALLFAVAATFWLVRRSRKLSRAASRGPAHDGSPPDLSSLDSRRFPPQHRAEWPAPAE